MSLSGKKLLPGMSGDEVKLLQFALGQLGHFISDEELNSSFYGKGTAQAVAAFQQNNGLQPTGTVDEGTAKAINAIADQLNPKSDPQPKPDPQKSGPQPKLDPLLKPDPPKPDPKSRPQPTSGPPNPSLQPKPDAVLPPEPNEQSAIYPPQQKNPKGEVHEDLGFIGYDRA